MTQTRKPVRVLRIIARLNIGGPAIHVSLLAQKLGPPDYESTLVCGQIEPGEGDMAYFAEQRGVHPVILPELGRSLHPVKDIRTIWKLYRLIRRYQPDVVHTHTAKAGFVGRIAARLAGVPVVVHTFHGHVFHGYFSPAKTQVFLILERIAARLSDRIITLSAGLRDELADTYRITSKKKIVVLPLGLDLNAFARTPRKTGSFRQAWQIAVEAPLIGIVGRLVPIKNHRLFLDAAARVRASLPNARFAVIGDGDLRPQLEAQVDSLGLHDTVIFTGWQHDLSPVYSDLDALVISSDNEGTPVSIIEALAAGCPVVATAVGGLPDLLENGRLGMLTRPGDPDALAEAIAHTLHDPQENKSTRTVIGERYGIDRLVSDLDRLYREILAQKKRLHS